MAATLNPVTDIPNRIPYLIADGSQYACTWGKPTAAKGTTLKGYWIRWHYNTVDNPKRDQYEDSQIDDKNVTISFFATNDLYITVWCEVWATYTVDKKTKYSKPKSSQKLSLRFKLTTPGVPTLEYQGNDSRQGKATVTDYVPTEIATYKANWLIFRIYQWDANDTRTTINKYVKFNDPYPDGGSVTFPLAEGCRYRAMAAAYRSKNTSDGSKAWFSECQYWSDFSELSDASSPLYGPPPAPVGGITKLVAHTTSSVRVYWTGVSDYKYQVEYTTDNTLFDTGAELSSYTTAQNGMSYADITGLEMGKTYYFRVRTVHAEVDSVYSDWSATKMCTLGSRPSAPTTWALSSAIDSDQDAKLYWTHNSTDNSQLTKSQIELTDGVNTPVVIDQNRIYKKSDDTIAMIHRVSVTKSGSTYIEDTDDGAHTVSDSLKAYLLTTESETQRVPVMTTGTPPHEVYRVGNVIETSRFSSKQDYNTLDTTHKQTNWVTDQGRDVYSFVSSEYVYYADGYWYCADYQVSSPVEQYFFVSSPDVGDDDTVSQFLVLESGSTASTAMVPRTIPVRVVQNELYQTTGGSSITWDFLYGSDKIHTASSASDFDVYKRVTQNVDSYSEKQGPYYTVEYSDGMVSAIKRVLNEPVLDRTTCVGGLQHGSSYATKTWYADYGLVMPETAEDNSGRSYTFRKFSFNYGYVTLTGGTRYPSSGSASFIILDENLDSPAVSWVYAWNPNTPYRKDETDRPYSSIGVPSGFLNSLGEIVYGPQTTLHQFDFTNGFMLYTRTSTFVQTSENLFGLDLSDATDTGEVTDTGMPVYSKNGVYFTNYTFSEDIHWRVRTMGLLLNNSESASFSNWSIMRQVKIYVKPQVALTLIDGVEGEDERSYVVDSFPMKIRASVTPVNSLVQNPVSYSFKIVSQSDYETTDETGVPRTVNAGDIMYSKVIVSTATTMDLDIQASDVLLSDNMVYSIECRVGMSSGLIADTEVDGGSLVITPSWSYSEYYVGFGLDFETDFCVANISAACYDMVDNVYQVTLITTDQGRVISSKTAVAEPPAIEPYILPEYYVSGTEPLVLPQGTTPILNPYLYTNSTSPEQVYYYSLNGGTTYYYCVNRNSEYYSVSRINSVSQVIDIITDPETGDETYVYYDRYYGPQTQWYIIAREPSDTISETGMLSVYRINTDNTFTHIASGTVGALNCTDPHPVLTTASYRVVVQNVNTGQTQFEDYSDETHFPNEHGPDYEHSILLQWNEAVVTYSAEDDESVDPPYYGSFLALPYDVDVSDNYQPDVVLVDYAGAEEPQSYYGTQKGHTATWQCNIIKKDMDTLNALRRLSRYSGDVYVREPSGSGYWANISVSFSQTHAELVIPVTLNVTKVRGGA